MSDESTQPLKGLVYSSDGTMHVIPSDAEMWVDAYLGEKESALCGGSFPHDRSHPVNGLRMTDEVIKGQFCNTCLDRLRDTNINISSFMDDGELVGEAARAVDRTGERTDSN